ncbi:MAG: NfeD family protein [Gammaproteobacteria bacterium]|nr:NfeD family protein [Gammaproteobacteria bacterium]MDH5628659.1 NfeD family protein [Gammaproteobacteria bacterium]
MFESIAYWHWIAIGIVLFILEMLAPGAIFMWFGFGAVAVGVLLVLMPTMGIEWQIFIFAVLSFGSVFGWKYWRKNSPEDNTESGTLNQRGKAMVGRKAKLIEPISNGVGKVQIDGTYWRVEGEDMKLGVLVEVTETEGVTLKVKKAE